MRPLIQYRPTAGLEARLAARAREWGVTSLGEAARRLAILADRGLTPDDHADVLKLSRALGGRGAGPFCDAADFISHRRTLDNGS